MIHTIKVLDHGFVTLRNLAGPTRRVFNGAVDNLTVDGAAVTQVLTEDLREFDADDTDPANAARMSFDETDSGRLREEDLRLSKYLMKNKHTSPFEMVQCWFEMKLPIFVARQFVRHRTVRLNEMSGRYVTLPAEWYIPEVVGGKAASAKQGQEDNLDVGSQISFKIELDRHCSSGYQSYITALARGIAPEHARLLLSLNHYTHWLWNQDLHNLMHFLMLRDHLHAQVEAQAYAKAIDQLVRQVLPETMTLYDQFRRMA